MRHGRVYPKDRGTGQSPIATGFPSSVSLELAYLDTLASVEGMMARRVVLEQHLSQIATSPDLWPTVARLRAFRGVDTLTALGLARARAEHPSER